jgi:hypothetical protein
MSRKHWFDYRPQETEQHKIDACSCCQAWFKAIDAKHEVEKDHIELWRNKAVELVEAISDWNDVDLVRFNSALNAMKKWLGWDDYLEERVEEMRDKQ